jgi:hypoxanthine phosphoribosyltransferase
MLNEIKQVAETAELLYSQEQVEAAIHKMAAEINFVLADKNPIILCALNGGIVITGQLLTRLRFPLTLDAINASRYRNQTTGQNLQWIQKPNTPLLNRNVLIIDDILDEGLTLQALCEYCHQQGANTVYTAVLIDKQLDSPKPIQADFIGLKSANYYLFGYGMDYKAYLRNAAGIYACKESE